MAKKTSSVDEAKAEFADSKAPELSNTPETPKAEKAATTAKASKSAEEVSKEEAAAISAAQCGSTYLPDKKERHLYHAVLDKPIHDKKTGERLSKPFVQKYTVSDWKQFESINQKSLGYTAKVVWDPTKYHN